MDDKIGPATADRVALMTATLMRQNWPYMTNDEAVTDAVNLALRICREVDRHVRDEHRWSPERLTGREVARQILGELERG